MLRRTQKPLSPLRRVTTSLERLELEAPFQQIVHRWNDITKARDEEPDPTTKAHADLFYRVMNEELKDIIDRMNDLLANGVITFDLLWTIMEPEDVVVSSRGGSLRAYQFSMLSLSQSGWTASVKYVEYNGSAFGFASDKFVVNKFTGTVPTILLPICPLKHHKDKDAIWPMLVARGKRWEEHMGYHYKAEGDGAVLLLDEADVFMQARDATDLERNGLVSIFLRMLEYYEGILFLTTNRADNIDPAFESRIHLSLQYKDLDSKSRRHIWAQFLVRSAPTGAFTDEQLDQVAEVVLNGRQIKNVIKTAGLLARAQDEDLQYSHIQTVLTLRELPR
ncbi:uncharacterized protein N7511_005655 [Penicillium nucicola]|uniref:uncharacterized protein n=1 Tax=Penicillium nucicola TaxID=1850975 RepID=UPI002544F8F2|nr:uncharacterized protein N7511_005655 [Penicillium nucicola]KAJ5762273.1 hypothetical protein N7511_005655 [Penicillium nucicola]